MSGSLKIRFSNGCCCIRYHFLVKVSLKFGSPITADIFIQFKADRLQMIVVAKKNISVLQLFISRMPKMCAILQLVSAPLIRDSSLHFCWSCSKPAACLGTIVATSIELHCSVEGAVGEGISLTEDQFEELQTVRQDISDSTDVDSDESNQELEEQIGQCNMPARTRCSRRVRGPARYHNFL